MTDGTPLMASISGISSCTQRHASRLGAYCARLMTLPSKEARCFGLSRVDTHHLCCVCIYIYIYIYTHTCTHTYAHYVLIQRMKRLRHTTHTYTHTHTRCDARTLCGGPGKSRAGRWRCLPHVCRIIGRALGFIIGGVQGWGTAICSREADPTAHLRIPIRAGIVPFAYSGFCLGQGGGGPSVPWDCGGGVGVVFPGRSSARLGKGQTGRALMGSLQIVCFLTEELFGYSR